MIKFHAQMTPEKYKQYKQNPFPKWGPIRLEDVAQPQRVEETDLFELEDEAVDSIEGGKGGSNQQKTKDEEEDELFVRPPLKEATNSFGAQDRQSLEAALRNIANLPVSGKKSKKRLRKNYAMHLLQKGEKDERDQREQGQQQQQQPSIFGSASTKSSSKGTTTKRTKLLSKGTKTSSKKPKS